MGISCRILVEKSEKTIRYFEEVGYAKAKNTRHFTKTCES